MNYVSTRDIISEHKVGSDQRRTKVFKVPGSVGEALFA